MPDYTVIRVGSDTSGRGLFFTRYAWRVWKAVLAQPEVKPFAHLVVIVQGAFMVRNGGGASASAGYHDWAGCWDVRTWNLTTKQVDALIEACRKAGIAAWRRDFTALHGGMDPHIHVTFGHDHPLSSGAKASWAGYLANENGLANRLADYEWRPSPLVTRPPDRLFQEDYMSTSAAERKLDKIIEQQSKLLDLANTEATTDQRRWARERELDRQDRARQSDRYRKLVAQIGGLADLPAEDVHEAVLKILASEPDVTQEDNPAPQEES